MATTTAPNTVDDLLGRVNDIAPTIGQHGTEAEQSRRVSRPVVDAMLEAGLFRMARPRVFGGLELDPVSVFRVVEEVSRHDSAAGWNLNLSLAGDPLLAWLPDPGAEEIASTPDLILGGALFPSGSAVPTDGGYRVTGQWAFVSGCHHAKWLLVVAVLMDDAGREPVVDEGGNPKQLITFVPADQVTIVDTWHTLGMRGTGSHDVNIADVFVPARRTALMAPLDKPGAAYHGPLYRLTIWTGIALLAPPALGIARAAVEDFVELAHSKTPSFTALGLRDRHVVQRQVAQAEAHLAAGRAFLYDTFRDSWEAAVNGVPIDLHRKLRMQLAATHAIACATTAVDLIHTAAGTSAIRDELGFQRYFRDVHTASQHAHASTQRYESVGAELLGAQGDWGFFAL